MGIIICRSTQNRKHIVGGNRISLLPFVCRSLQGKLDNELLSINTWFMFLVTCVFLEVNYVTFFNLKNLPDFFIVYYTIKPKFFI